jgi:hypothetical protein
VELDNPQSFKDRKYRVAVIGCGRIGAQLEKDSLRMKPCTHLGAWLKHKDRCDVVAYSDTDSYASNYANILCGHYGNFGNGEDFTKAGHWAYNDYEDLMNKAKPDIVSIATPDETHLKIARVVMRYDPVKLVFLEKPIAKTLSEAQLIIDTAREFKVKLAINHTRRWDPIWQEVAKVCARKPPQAMICYTSGSKIRDGVHMADLINWFRPEQSLLVNPQRESGLVDYLLFEVDLLFHDQRIRVTDNGYNSTMYVSQPSQHFEGFREMAQSCHVSRLLYPQSPMYLATEQLLDCLDVENGKKTGVTDPLCTGEQGKKALEVALGW